MMKDMTPYQPNGHPTNQAIDLALDLTGCQQKAIRVLNLDNAKDRAREKEEKKS